MVTLWAATVASVHQCTTFTMAHSLALPPPALHSPVVSYPVPAQAYTCTDTLPRPSSPQDPDQVVPLICTGMAHTNQQRRVWLVTAPTVGVPLLAIPSS